MTDPKCTGTLVYARLRRSIQQGEGGASSEVVGARPHPLCHRAQKGGERDQQHAGERTLEMSPFPSAWLRASDPSSISPGRRGWCTNRAPRLWHGKIDSLSVEECDSSFPLQSALIPPLLQDTMGARLARSAGSRCPCCAQGVLGDGAAVVIFETCRVFPMMYLSVPFVCFTAVVFLV